uniref:SMK-1 domain-containing protein n=1 Tax=Trichuris muris TaxID=70415 RepID=A0A5S6QX46_TRIMR
MPFFVPVVTLDRLAALYKFAMEDGPNQKRLEDARHRVKLYMLNEKRTWDDKGTGQVTCSFNEQLQCLTLKVISEEEGSPMLESQVQLDTVYQKQQGTLIVWTESENNDMALSFQDRQGCDEVWEAICKVQGKDPRFDTTQDANSDSVSDDDVGENGAVRLASEPLIELPPCDIPHLTEIHDFITSSFGAAARRDAVAYAIEAEEYIPKLLDLFHKCEDLEDIESLHMLYRTFKSIFYLNKSTLIEILFTPERLIDVIGVLEYDPSCQTPKPHRNFLWEQAKFKQVIPISSPELTTKIHQTYRIQYVHDVIFPAPSIFEENMLSFMSTIIVYNKAEIVHLIQEDPMFLKELFAMLTSAETPTEKLVDLAGFLKELVSFSQLLNVQNRDGFFKTLASNGILKVLENCFSRDDVNVRSLAVDIVSCVTEYNSALVREYALREESPLVGSMIEVMLRDPDPEMSTALQLSSVIRILLDPESMLTSFSPKCDKYDFLTFFYKKCMPKLCSPLFKYTGGGRLIKDNYRTANLMSVLLDMLTFCIEHHSYHIRGFVITRDLLAKVLVFLQSRHSFLVLGALRLFRRTLNLRDDVYISHIIRQRLFDPVVKCFVANGRTYNLLNSALLELFEFIRAENIKSLAAHIVENYFDHFKEVDYVNTFQLLRVRYEQQSTETPNDDDASKDLASLSVAKSLKERGVDDEEEQWFNDDEEDWQCPSTVDTQSTLRELSSGRSLTSTTTVNDLSPDERNQNVLLSPPLANNGSVPHLPPLRISKLEDDDDRDFPLEVSVKPVARKMTIVINTSSSDLARRSEKQSSADASPNCVRALVDYGDSDEEESPDETENVSQTTLEPAIGEDTAQPKSVADLDLIRSKKLRIDQPSSPK